MAESFEKHYARSCEKICFSGMPLTFLSENGYSVSVSLSIGGCVAFAKRADGRFNAEFDNGRKRISCNVLDLKNHTEEPMLEVLLRAEKLSVKPGGADMVFDCNTELFSKFDAVLITAMYFFCENMPGILSLKGCLDDFSPVEIVGKKGSALFCRGERTDHIGFPDGLYKIVLCSAEEKNILPESRPGSVLRCVSALIGKDYEKFSQVITEESEIIAQTGSPGAKSRNIFSLALKLADASGCGFFESGVFAVVKNERVNAFIQNLRSQYENYYGAAPDFYIAGTADSGINAVM